MAIRTKRYRELELRHLKLNQLFGALVELKLHLNRVMNPETSAYYKRVMENYGSFFVPSIESINQVFYVELNGFIGAHWDAATNRIIPGRFEGGSLYGFLFDSKRVEEKRIPKEMFERLLREEAEPLGKLRELRHKLAHFKALDDRNAQIITNYNETKRILNRLAEILYKLGYQRGNVPHYYKDDNSSSDAVQQVVDKLTFGESRVKMRQEYRSSRTRWLTQ